jgi:hypothetical protein
MSYTLAIDGLADRVAAVTPGASHERLLVVLRAASPALMHATVAARRDGYWLGRRKVVSASGALIHDDHRAFLAAEIDAAGNAAAAMRRLQALGHRLTQCNLTKLYVVSDHGGSQDAFVQAIVDVEDECIDRRLFSEYGWWREPRDLDDLCDAAEGSTPLDGDARARHRPVAYRLGQVIDFAAFMAEASAVHWGRRETAAHKVLRVTDMHPDRPPVTRDATIIELDPDMMRFEWQGQRMFDDWSASSAGRSGARVCASWVFQTSDHTDARGGLRSVSFVPAWTHARKIAPIKPKRVESDYGLYGRLEAIDRRVDVPFAWYFYMLHGNLVEPWAGERVLHAAEAGLIVLPEHDYRVLKRWSGRSYGF